MPTPVRHLVIGGGIVGLAVAERVPGAPRRRGHRRGEGGGLGGPPDRPQQRGASTPASTTRRDRSRPHVPGRGAPAARVRPRGRHPPCGVRQARRRHAATSCPGCARLHERGLRQRPGGHPAHRRRGPRARAARRARGGAARARDGHHRLRRGLRARWSATRAAGGDAAARRRGARRGPSETPGRRRRVRHTTSAGELAADRVVACAGLHGDRVARRLGDRARGADRAVPRRVLRAAPGGRRTWCAAWSTRCPTRRSRSSGCTSPGHRRPRPRRPQRRAGLGPRGLRTGATVAPARLRRHAGLPGLLAAGRRHYAGRRRRGAPFAVAAPRSPRACAGWCPRCATRTCVPAPAGVRAQAVHARRLARRRLPHRARRTGGPRPQRALAGRDQRAGDRPPHRRRCSTKLPEPQHFSGTRAVE